MADTVAEQIVSILVRAGVKRIYGIPGDSINPLVDAIRKNKGITYVQTRHEEGAAFEAAFDARVSGNISACMGTSGPGSIHLLNGLYEAKMDGVPVIALTGQVETDMIGRDYFQEVDLNKLFEDVSIYNKQIVNPDSAQYIAWRACREAILNGGVAHLTLPVDILKAPSKTNFETDFDSFFTTRFSVDASAATDAIDASSKPVIVVGRGVKGSEQMVLRLSETIGAPIIYALNAKGIFDDYDDRVMGGMGLLGSKPGVEAMDGSDLIIFLGTSFPYYSFVHKGTKTIQVDINPRNIGKRFPATLPYNCDVKTFLSAIKPKEKKKKHYYELKDSKRKWLTLLEQEEESSGKLLNPQTVAAEVSKHLTTGSIIAVDTGNVTVWGMRNIRTRGGVNFLFSPWLGSMGIGIPAAIGASFATDQPVTALVGDGSFAMTMMELITARKYNRNIKIVVFNNSKLGMIKFEEEVMGYPEWGVDLLNPDFGEVAKAMGIYGDHVETPEQLPDAVSKLMNSNGPGVLDVKVDPNERPMPPKLTFSQAKGYITSLLRERLLPTD
ncbi:pyruvate oxidase [Thermoplasmatales archaeon AK]|nr:pyruvate oxidase [Thermoplasmatales archaeon AK]